jgi:hypothetical protein
MRNAKTIAWLTVCVGALLGCGAPRGVQPSELSPAGWVALAKPGEAHELLDMFVGTWDVTVSSSSGPLSPADTSHGTSRSSWILGSRFVEERFEGAVSGSPYQGLGLIGYDSGARQYTTVWLDSLSTALAVSRGRYDSARNSFELQGEVYDPLLGREKSTKTRIDIESRDLYHVSMLESLPDGREYAALRISYRRTAANPR